jgi:hypothetical protein
MKKYKFGLWVVKIGALLFASSTIKTPSKVVRFTCVIFG